MEEEMNGMQETAMEAQGLMQDVSQPMIEGAIHHCALGSDVEYRALAQAKVLVDKCFGDVQNGKLNPKVALKCIKSELRTILTIV